MANIIDPPNSEWPNGLKVDSEGYVTFYPLGTNKVDITTIDWPDGDTLISPFVYQNGKLVGFADTKAMTVSGSATTTMNYNHIEADFSSISEGKLTVNAPNAVIKKFSWAVSMGGDESFDFVIIDFTTTDQETIDTVRTAKRVVDNKLYDSDGGLIGTWDTSKLEVAGFINEEAEVEDEDGLFYNYDVTTDSDRGIILSEFNSDLISLRDGTSMFYGCSQLNSFASDLSSLTSGSGMFFACSQLNSFSSDLSSLTDGQGMFYYCFDLTSFSSDLSSLTDGTWMFTGCTNLTTFASDLSSLTSGSGMFISCSQLNSFSSDLSSLTDGMGMFGYCSNLTSFSSDLSNLMDGSDMFSECKLDAPSVKNIIETINTVSSGVLTLGIGCDSSWMTNTPFFEEIGYSSAVDLGSAFTSKGWTVNFQYNGSSTSTYSMRRTAEEILPIFVKLIEVEETSDKFKFAHTHTSEDGSKKYRLNWFHETTGSTEGYTQFNSLEEAIEALNIKPIERN